MMRCGDVATDLAFLAMDLRYRGRLELARGFVDEYVRVSGDRGVFEVLHELVRYRAMVRAKVDALGAQDQSIESGERARLLEAARRHLRLLAWTAVEDEGPFAVIACGLPGSGKSHLLGALARETGWPLLATDALRKELAGVSGTARLPAAAYAAASRARVYALLIERASATPGPVLLDGNFARRALRDAARRASPRRSLLLHVAVDDAVAAERLHARVQRGDDASDADAAVRARLAADFEAVDAEHEAPLLWLDGALPLSPALDRLAVALLRLRGGPAPLDVR
jgi:predicted kinase